MAVDDDDNDSILNKIRNRNSGSGGSSKGFLTAGKIILVILVLIVLSSCTVQIEPGFEGVIVNQLQGGVQPIAMGPGIHFKEPFVEHVIPMETRVQKVEKMTDASSSDMQDVYATIALNYHLMGGSTPNVYSNIGMDYQDRVIMPAIDESTKAATAKYTAAELITKRPVVKADLTDAITKRLAAYSITVDQVSITDFNFSVEYTKAIEAKQVAEQNAEKATNDLHRIQIESQQTVVTAMAQANATKAAGDANAYAVEKMGEALKNNPDVAQIKWIEKWDGQLPFYVTSSSSGSLMMIDANGNTATTSK